MIIEQSQYMRVGATLTLGLFFVCTPHFAHAAKLEVSGWIPYWRAESGTADARAHLDRFTEVNPFAYSVTSDGTLVDTAKLSEEPWTSFIAEAQAKKVRVIPTIMWSDSEAMHRILSNQKTRIALADAIVAEVNAKGFDGIDIDFENKKAETKPYFSTFLKGLYQRMGKKWVMCTIEPRTPLDSRFSKIPKDIAYANDYKEINKYCDRVRIMAYDQGTVDIKLNEQAPGPYIPVSDPKWVEKVITLAAKDISKKKLVIGIPTYGYEYDLIPLSQYGYRYDRKWAFNPRYATDLAKSLGMTPTRTASGELSLIYPIGSTPQSGQGSEINPLPEETGGPAAAAAALPSTPTMRILWWSDAVAISHKIMIAERLGVRGVAIFKIDGGEDPLMWSVLP